MICRAYSEPNLFIIGISCIPGHARVRGSYECLARETFEPPTKIFAQPPPRRPRNYESNLKCPAVQETRTSHEIIWDVISVLFGLMLCFLISKKHHWVLLIIVSSTKWSEYISDNSRTIYRKSISDMYFLCRPPLARKFLRMTWRVPRFAQDHYARVSGGCTEF